MRMRRLLDDGEDVEDRTVKGSDGVGLAAQEHGPGLTVTFGRWLDLMRSQYQLVVPQHKSLIRGCCNDSLNPGFLSDGSSPGTPAGGSPKR
jgi:hypothetical protein